MKKFFMISVLMVALPLSMVAQDDLYFVPKKKRAEVVEVTTPINNRVKSQYEVIQNDSTNDIIDFDGQKGVYPDSIVTEDFELTKRMQRFDDYDLSDNAAFWAGYHLGRDTWNWGLSWHSPWYYTRYGWYGGFYDPWYYGYYDPWYYGYYGWRDPWYYGYYDPFYYGYYGYYYPWRYGYYGYYSVGYPYFVDVYYGGAPRRYSANRTTGTQNHGRIDYTGPRGISNGRTTTHSSGTFGGSALGGNRASSTRTTAASSGSVQRTTVRNASGNFGGNRANRTYSTSNTSSNRNQSGGFTNSTTRTTSSASSSSRSSMGSSSGGGSFGGSRGGGSTIGGSRSSGGGGGSFGGGRRR